MEYKVVVMAGASSGIGATPAKQPGGDGYKLALAARRGPELDQVTKEAETVAWLLSRCGNF